MNPHPPVLNMHRNPVWFNDSGRFMRLTDRNTERKTMVVRGSAATLWINPIKLPMRRGPTAEDTMIPDDRRWLIRWKIRFGLYERVNGKVLFTDSQLSAAFGLTAPDVETHNQWLLKDHGADCADRGKYIRWGSFLNIPGPGTGHNGDANISILLDPQMASAVADLLK